MQVTIRFGVDEVTRTYQEGTSIGTVTSDRDVRVQLGYGDNVRALVAGVEQSPSAIAPDGGTIVVETRANSKAN